MKYENMTLEELMNLEMEAVYKMWASEEGTEERRILTIEHDEIDKALRKKAGIE